MCFFLLDELSHALLFVNIFLGVSHDHKYSPVCFLVLVVVIISVVASVGCLFSAPDVAVSHGCFTLTNLLFVDLFQVVGYNI